jgi:hypothetical protein
MIWFAASILLSMFAGGFVAGHMSGFYYDNDGVLHGLVTWAVVTLIGLFALTSSVGSVLSGAMSVASTAITAAGSAVGSAAGAVAPEVADALNLQDLTMRGIQADIRNLMNNASETGVSNTGTTGSTTDTGSNTDTTTGTADTGTTGGTTDTAMATAEPGSTDTGSTTDTTTDTGTTSSASDTSTSSSNTGTRMGGVFSSNTDGTSSTTEVMSLNEVTFNRALSNLLNGDNVTQADRDEVVAMLAANTGITEDEARAMVQNWEQTYMEVRQEAEETARRVAQAAADAVTAFAGAMFAAMVVGAFAAGLGGMTGTPQPNFSDPDAVRTTKA